MFNLAKDLYHNRLIVFAEGHSASETVLTASLPFGQRFKAYDKVARDSGKGRSSSPSTSTLITSTAAIA